MAIRLSRQLFYIVAGVCTCTWISITLVVIQTGTEDIRTEEDVYTHYSHSTYTSKPTDEQKDNDVLKWDRQRNRKQYEDNPIQKEGDTENIVTDKSEVDTNSILKWNHHDGINDRDIEMKDGEQGHGKSDDDDDGGDVSEDDAVDDDTDEEHDANDDHLDYKNNILDENNKNTIDAKDSRNYNIELKTESAEKEVIADHLEEIDSDQNDTDEDDEYEIDRAAKYRDTTEDPDAHEHILDDGEDDVEEAEDNVGDENEEMAVGMENRIINDKWNDKLKVNQQEHIGKNDINVKAYKDVRSRPSNNIDVAKDEDNESGDIVNKGYKFPIVEKVRNSPENGRLTNSSKYHNEVHIGKQPFAKLNRFGEDKHNNTKRNTS